MDDLGKLLKSRGLAKSFVHWGTAGKVGSRGSGKVGGAGEVGNHVERSAALIVTGHWIDGALDSASTPMHCPYPFQADAFSDLNSIPGPIPHCTRPLTDGRPGGLPLQVLSAESPPVAVS